MRVDSKQTVMDPVCGMQIDPLKAAASVCHAGREIFFCAPECKQAFEFDPERYLKKSAKRKTFWQRYLERLNKATGGKPPACH
jgi:YHS domain-containing protein